MKGVQCYELFGGISHKNHTFSFSFFCQKLWHSINTCPNEDLFEVRLYDRLYVQRAMLLNKCLVAGRLLQRFHPFMMALLVWTMAGWYVCTRGRQLSYDCSFCCKRTFHGSLINLFQCFMITMIK